MKHELFNGNRIETLTKKRRSDQHQTSVGIIFYWQKPSYIHINRLHHAKSERISGFFFSSKGCLNSFNVFQMFSTSFFGLRYSHNKHRNVNVIRGQNSVNLLTYYFLCACIANHLSCQCKIFMLFLNAKQNITVNHKSHKSSLVEYHLILFAGLLIIANYRWAAAVEAEAAMPAVSAPSS